MAKARGPRKAGDILKGLIRSNPTLQGGLRGKVAKALIEALGELVPEEAQEHCFFLRYARGTVTVGVDAAVYHHELQCYYVQELLEKLKAKIPQANILKVRFEIAPRPERPGPEA